MTDTIPRTITETQAARARPCPLCEAPPGAPCRAKPEADHLARFLDAYVAGRLSRAYLAAVVGELVVIDRAVMIPAVTVPAPRAAADPSDPCPDCGAAIVPADSPDGDDECTGCGALFPHTGPVRPWWPR